MLRAGPVCWKTCQLKKLLVCLLAVSFKRKKGNGKNQLPQKFSGQKERQMLDLTLPLEIASQYWNSKFIMPQVFAGNFITSPEEASKNIGLM